MNRPPRVLQADDDINIAGEREKPVSIEWMTESFVHVVVGV